MTLPFLRSRPKPALVADSAETRPVLAAVPVRAPEPSPEPEVFDASAEEETLRAVFAALDSASAEPLAGPADEPAPTSAAPVVSSQEPEPPQSLDVVAEPFRPADQALVTPADQETVPPELADPIDMQSSSGPESPLVSASGQDLHAATGGTLDTQDMPQHLDPTAAVAESNAEPADDAVATPQPEVTPTPPLALEPAADVTIAAAIQRTVPSLADLSDDALTQEIRKAESAVGSGGKPKRRAFESRFAHLGRAAAIAPAATAFAVAVFAPLPLILLGLTLGGLVAALALIAVLGFAVLSIPLARAARNEAGTTTPFPLSGRPSLVLPFLHFAVLAAGLAALGGATGLGFLGWILSLFGLSAWLALGPVRQARMMATSKDPRRRRIAEAMFTVLLMGQRATVERLILPRFAATSDDPHTAEPGESFYAFALRAFAGGFVAGHALAATLMLPRMGRRRTMVHPYILYLFGAGVMLTVTGALFAPLAVPAILFISALVQMIVLLDDYVTRYGLQRRKLSDGKLEPLGQKHAWAAPDPLPRLVSKTGKAPGIPAPASPVMPRPLPVMICFALVPKLWHGEMDGRVMAMLKRQAESARPAEFIRPAVSRLAGAAKV